MPGMGESNRRLMWHGMFLFLLGLLTGFAEPRFANMRMGLAAHLEGVMNGIFLIGLGAIWNEVRLSPAAKTAVFWIALIGTYGNWLMTTTAAVFGTSALSPITGTPHGGQPWQEKVVTAGFMVIGIVIVACAVFVLCGLRKPAREVTRG
jgi:hydroxylaminobenzene mutase